MMVQGLLLWNSFCVWSGGEVPDFVEFTVVGQILLGHHAQYLSGIADCQTFCFLIDRGIPWLVCMDAYCRKTGI